MSASDGQQPQPLKIPAKTFEWQMLTLSAIFGAVLVSLRQGFLRLRDQGDDPWKAIYIVILPIAVFLGLVFFFTLTSYCPHCGRRGIRRLKSFPSQGFVLRLFGCRICKQQIVSWDGGRTFYDPIACGLGPWLAAEFEGPRLDASELTLDEVQQPTLPGLPFKDQRQVRGARAWFSLLLPRRFRTEARAEPDDLAPSEGPAAAVTVGRMESLVRHQRERKQRAGGDEPGR